jgi:hypothetical protein
VDGTVEPLKRGYKVRTGVPLAPEHVPERAPYPMHLAGKQVKARRTVPGGSATRWCATSETALEPSGKEKFCDECIKKRQRERMATARQKPVSEVPVDAVRLRRLRAEARTWRKVSNDYIDNRAIATDKENELRLSQVLGVGKLLLNTIDGLPDPPRPN